MVAVVIENTVEAAFAGLKVEILVFPVVVVEIVEIDTVVAVEIGLACRSLVDSSFLVNILAD